MTRPLSKDRILDAAIALADAEGMAKLSMRKLGERLGVEAMSLYGHVANKAEIVAEMIDRVAAEFHLPGDGPWKDEMRRRAEVAHAVLRRHPWAPQLFLSEVTAGPNNLAYVDATLGCLVRAGFTYPEADHVWNAMDSFIYGFTLKELNFPFAPETYAEAARAYAPQVPKDRLPHLWEMTWLVADRRHDGLQDLHFGLEILLDGLERMLAARR